MQNLISVFSTFGGVLILLLVVLCSCALAERFSLPAGVFPLPILGASVVLLLLGGMMFRRLEGVLWLLLAALFLGVVWGFLKLGAADIWRQFKTPSMLVLFFGGTFFWLLYAQLQPMFIQWDEFTFWGTACKIVKTQNILYPVAQGNLAARAYLPGMMLVSYLFMALGAFAEWKVLAAYAILFLSAMAACAALPKKQWATSAVLLVCAVLLPYFFSVPEPGAASKIYLNAMGDVSLAMGFGGTACVFFATAHTEHRRLGLALSGTGLCLLTLIKDMGFAYALILVMVFFLDLCVQQKKYGVKSFARQLIPTAALALPVLLCFLGWSKYCALTASIDKNSVGRAGVSYGGILIGGVMQLLGIGRTETFASLMDLMLRALWQTKVCLLGAGVVALGAIFLVNAAAFVTAKPGRNRRRVAITFAALAAAFVVFYLFHLFLYYYNFAEVEALALKDYDRYIGPYYQGWMLVSLCLLGQSVAFGRCPRLSRLAVLGVVACIGFAFVWRGVPESGFWDDSDTLYELRRDVQTRAAAVNPALTFDDTVLVISQGDDATRWYYYNYELNAKVAHGFGGYCRGADEKLDQWESTFMNLVEAGSWSLYDYQAVCTRPGLEYYLEKMGCNYILIDGVDTYFREEFGPMFTEELPVDMGGGARLYEIEGSGDEMRFLPVNETDSAVK